MVVPEFILNSFQRWPNCKQFCVAVKSKLFSRLVVAQNQKDLHKNQGCLNVFHDFTTEITSHRSIARYPIRPRPGQRIIAFGAAAAMVHPSTGESLGPEMWRRIFKKEVDP